MRRWTSAQTRSTWLKHGQRAVGERNERAAQAPPLRTASPAAAGGRTEPGAAGVVTVRHDEGASRMRVPRRIAVDKVAPRAAPIVRVGQAIHPLGLALRLVAARWRPVTPSDADERVMDAALAAASLGCRVAGPAVASSAADGLHQLKDCRHAVLAGHCDSCQQRRARRVVGGGGQGQGDGDPAASMRAGHAEEGEAVHDPATVKAKRGGRG